MSTAVTKYGRMVEPKICSVHLGEYQKRGDEVIQEQESSVTVGCGVSFLGRFINIFLGSLSGGEA